jgi:hypothetical protein
MNRTSVLSLWGIVALTAGCAMRALPPPTVEGESVPPCLLTFGRSDWEIEAEEVANLLAYFHRMSGVSAEDLRKEYAAQTAAYGRDKSESARLKLILLLSLPASSVRDDARLVGLLDTAPNRAAANDLPRRQLVVLLSRIHADRVRQVTQLRDDGRKHEAQLKEEMRERLDESGRRADEQQKRADEQQRRADDLQLKLDKLIGIERELRRSPRRPPG